MNQILCQVQAFVVEKVTLFDAALCILKSIQLSGSASISAGASARVL